jgi:hypothetical protein
MKKHLENQLCRIVVLLSISTLALLPATESLGQQAKVIKVKGKQAIVAFPEGLSPQVGQLLSISDTSTDTQIKAGPGSRAHQIGFTADVAMVSATTNGSSTTTTSLGAQNVKYGWNDGKMEYGPLATLAYTSGNGTSGTTIGGGGFFDFNLVPNKIGNDLIWGFGGLATIQQASVNTGYSTTTTTYDIFGGAQAKWFPFGNSIAVRGDAGLDYNMQNQSPGFQTTQLGLHVKGGISAYF